jgi:hypothetical protein
MKRVITERVVADLPLRIAAAAVRRDPWSMLASGSAGSGPPPAFDLGRLQPVGDGLRCHVRWTPDPRWLRDRWIRSTIALTAAGEATSIEMITRYLSEQTLGAAYGSGLVTHRSLTHASRQIVDGIRTRLELDRPGAEQPVSRV